MKERKLFLFLTFLPLALALLFWDLDTGFSTQSPTQPNTLIQDELPTTILDRTRVTQYDLTGDRSQQITSDKLLSNDFQKQVAIERPTIAFETEDGIWITQSERGQFNQIENRLSLNGKVILTQNDGQRPVKMTTDKLDYFPNTRLAETDAPVVIESEGHRLESQGLRVDLANSVFTLTEKVRSTHAPM